MFIILYILMTMKNLRDYLTESVYDNISKIQFDWTASGKTIKYHGIYRVGADYRICASGFDWWIDRFADTLCSLNLPANVAMKSILSRKGLDIDFSKPARASSGLDIDPVIINMLKDTPMLEIDGEYVFLAGPCNITPGLIKKIYKKDPELMEIVSPGMPGGYSDRLCISATIAAGVSLGWLKQYGVIDKSKGIKDIIDDNDLSTLIWDLMLMILEHWRYSDVVKMFIKNKI